MHGSVSGCSVWGVGKKGGERMHAEGKKIRERGHITQARERGRHDAGWHDESRLPPPLLGRSGPRRTRLESRRRRPTSTPAQAAGRRGYASALTGCSRSSQSLSRRRGSAPGGIQGIRRPRSAISGGGVDAPPELSGYLIRCAHDADPTQHVLFSSEVVHPKAGTR